MMNKSEYREKQQKLKIALAQLDLDYVEANRKFNFQDKVEIHSIVNGKITLASISNVTVDYKADIEYHLLAIKKDGTVGKNNVFMLFSDTLKLVVSI